MKRPAKKGPRKTMFPGTEVEDPGAEFSTRASIVERMRELARAEPPPQFAQPQNVEQSPPEPVEAGGEDQESLDLLMGELLRRQRARESLVEYARSIDIPGAPVSDDPACEVFKPVETSLALHHRVILQAIQECIDTDFGRLMIFAPPGSAKSSYTSVVTPAWAMARRPGFRVILTSYGAELAERMSRRCRAVCADPRHVSVWEDQPRLLLDQRAINDWQLSNGSGLVTGGVVQGAVTGNRADLLIIDDPVKGREDADSGVVQKKTIEGYKENLLTRLKPKASVILIQTRWHENDLAGSILPENWAGESGYIKCRDGQTWRVLNIPAECENEDDPLGRAPGQFLWPEWFPEQHWLNYKNDPTPGGQRMWGALYQQRPTAADGIEFKREWFRWYDPDAPAGTPGHYMDPKTGHFGQRGGAPKRLIPYGGSDFAVKEDRGADFTEHGVAGRDSLGGLWFTDWWYAQVTSDKYIDALILMMDRNRVRRWAHEGNTIGHAIGPALRDALRTAQRQRRHTCPIEEMPSIKSKAVKLASFQAKAAAGMVYLPINRPWAERLLAQLCAFPAGRWDDAADTAGLIGRLVDLMMDAKDDWQPPKDELKPFTGRWLEHEDPEDKPRIRYS